MMVLLLLKMPIGGLNSSACGMQKTERELSILILRIKKVALNFEFFLQSVYIKVINK